MPVSWSILMVALFCLFAFQKKRLMVLEEFWTLPTCFCTRQIFFFFLVFVFFPNRLYFNALLKCFFAFSFIYFFSNNLNPLHYIKLRREVHTYYKRWWNLSRTHEWSSCAANWWSMGIYFILRFLNFLPTYSVLFSLICEVATWKDWCWDGVEM